MGIEAVFVDVAKELKGEGVTFMGPSDFDAQAAAPRIYWEPRSATHSAPQGISGGPRSQGDLWLRKVAIGVSIWGSTLIETEELLVRFVNLVELLLSKNGYTLGGELWRLDDKSESFGAEVVLTLIVHVPLPREAKPTRPLEGLNPTYKLNQTAV